MKKYSVKYLVTFFLYLVGILMIVGSSPPPTTYTYNKPYFSTVMHNYDFNVIDIDGNPISGAKINYNVKERNNDIDSGTKLTNKNGKLEVNVVASPDPSMEYVGSYGTSINYIIDKDGYYGYKGNSSSFASNNSNIDIKAELVKPVDYFSKKFLEGNSDEKLKNNIIQLLDLIKLRGLLANAILKYRSISIIKFKHKKYVSIGFDSINVYNSIKLDRYDIGKELFDKVVRKILNPLNKYVNDSKFYGYKIHISGFYKNFANEYENNKALEFEFFMPKSVVREYKDLDISGQELLNKSIVLMDGERVELKLQ